MHVFLDHVVLSVPIAYDFLLGSSLIHLAVHFPFCFPRWCKVRRGRSLVFSEINLRCASQLYMEHEIIFHLNKFS